MDLTEFLQVIKPFRGSTVLVGFSGGADSTALLLLLRQFAAELNLKIEAVHFQHQLRGAESQADADWCRQFCETRRIPFREVKLDVRKAIEGGDALELAARKLRIQQWQQMCPENGVVALAHHADDRVENLLIRLIRGANLSGLTSLRPVQNVHGVRFVRPLLAYPKSGLVDFLTEQGIGDWREDSSNHDIKMLRNFFRNEILDKIYAEYDYSLSGLQRALEVLECDALYLEEGAKEQFSKITGAATTPVQFWKNLPEALRIRVLRLWLSELIGEEFIPDASLLTRFKTALTISSRTGETFLVPMRGGRFLARRLTKVFMLERFPTDNGENHIRQLWNWREEPEITFKGCTVSAEVQEQAGDFCSDDESTAVFNAELLPENLLLRSWQPGDRMEVFGDNREVKLKKLFLARKIPEFDKPDHPLVCLPGGLIIWVGGVRRSNFAPVEEETGAVVKFTFQRTSDRNI